MTNYLGIDYGRKHLGLALADGPLARPLTTIDFKNTENSISTISQVIASNEIEIVVIGMPGGELDAEINKFGESLSRISNVKVVYHEETLSTKEALSALREAGAKRKKLNNDHVYAACLILEDYIESAK